MKIGSSLHLKLETTRFGNLTLGAWTELDSHLDQTEITQYREELGLESASTISDLKRVAHEIVKSQLIEQKQMIEESFSPEFYNQLT